MNKWRKKPIVIEAVRWTGTDESWNEVKEFTKDLLNLNDYRKDKIKCRDKNIFIETLEGMMAANINDWIIKEPFPTGDRDFYPCKPDIFEQTYELIEGE